MTRVGAVLGLLTMSFTLFTAASADAAARTFSYDAATSVTNEQGQAVVRYYGPALFGTPLDAAPGATAGPERFCADFGLTYAGRITFYPNVLPTAVYDLESRQVQSSATSIAELDCQKSTANGFRVHGIL